MLISVLAIMSIAVSAQSIWKPVPDNLFKTVDGNMRLSALPETWLWRFSALVVAEELSYNSESKLWESKPLSSIGPAAGYRHYSALPDGTPYNDFGINAALLLGTDINHIDQASMKAAIVINAFKFINVGGAYTFNNTNHWGILLGASVNF